MTASVMVNERLEAAKAGTFKVGGDITINRLGFGAMRITGKGIWDEPAGYVSSRATLGRVG